VADRGLYPRIQSPPEGSFFIFGPRGTGKSTWIEQRFPDAYRIDLLDERRFQELLVDPGLLADELRGIRPQSWVVLDEVQRVPALLNEVHRAIEERKLRFALVGSSARKLKTAGTNLLAGRAVRRDMFPFVPDELGDDFDLGAALRFGTIPVVWTAPDRDETLDAYVQLYLREEIRGEAVVRNLPGFLRFLPVSALCHGQVVSVSGLARDAGVARTTIDGYLGVLEDTLVATRLPAFEPRHRVRERKHPKLYWVDAGLVRAVKRQRGPVGSEESGPLLEGFVFTLLRAYAAARHLYDKIHYWAPAHGTIEVDFVLRRGKDLLGIEVKSQSTYSPTLTRGLRAIGDLHGVVRRVLVYRGRRTMRTSDGIDVFPVERFARLLADDELWP
jgi:predicted AAA+ superfamily ATPase